MKVRSWVVILLAACMLLYSSACADELVVHETVGQIDNMPDYPGEIACDILAWDGHLLFLFDGRVDSSWTLYVSNYDDDHSWQQYTFSKEVGGFLSETDNYTASDVDFSGYYDLQRIRTKEGSGLDEWHVVETFWGGDTTIRLTDGDGFWWEWTDDVFTGYGYAAVLSCYYKAGSLTKYIRRNLNADGSLGNVSVTYDPQGQIIEAEIDLDEGEYTYSKSYGWRCDYVSCDAPEGYGISDLKALLPPLVHVKVITLPEKITATFGEMGVNVSEMLDDVPECPAVYVKNGVLCIEAQSYEVISFMSSRLGLYMGDYDFRWKNGRWESVSSNIAEEAAQDYSLIVSGSGMNRSYRNGILSSCGWNVANGSIDWNSSSGVRVEVDSIGANATYSPSGRLKEYEYYLNADHVSISYTAEGEFLGVRGVDMLQWSEEGGWTTYDFETGMRVACDAPAGLEAYTTEEAWIAAYPPLIVVKVDKTVATFPITLKAFPDVPPVSIEAVLTQPEKLQTWLPAQTELEMTSDGVRFSDAGFAKARVIYQGAWIYDLVWDGKGWILEDTTLTPELLQSNRYFLYGYGDGWSCTYMDGELYSISADITEQDNLYFAPDASTVFSLTKGGAYTASYDSEGLLKEYRVSFPDSITNAYLPDGGIRELCYQVASEYGYRYYSPQQGWYYITYEVVGNQYIDKKVPCDPPAGCEDYDEALIQKLYPPLLGSYRALPSYYDATLPGDLRVIETQAFAGTSFRRGYIPDGAQALGAGAFKNCSELVFIRIPESVKEIATDAFTGCGDVTIVTPAGSYAEQFAKTYGFSWINE